MRVLVVGAAKSGRAVARFLSERGDDVILTDKRADACTAADLPFGVQLELGAHRSESFLGAELIVVSPGVPEIPELASARRAGVPIVGEVELASREIQAPIIGITGTNGKSTTTALCGAICAQTERPTFCGGNLGTPLIEAVGTKAARPNGLCVVELSSFQLETTQKFHPRVAVLLNITPDHLDRYPDVAAYVAAKARIFANQTAEDWAIVPSYDALASSAAEAGRARVLQFSTRPNPAGAAARVDKDELVLQVEGGDERYPISDLHLVGRHNWENALAAMLAARLVGASPTHVRLALASFRGLPHRMEKVAEGQGVVFYDDSKGTNVGAVVASLGGLEQSFVLIAGGRDKGGSYEPLLSVLGHCRAVVLIGEAAPRIEQTLREAVRIRRAESLSEAVYEALALAKPGDAVVLSPACSSYDMFQNYEERGRAFRAAVQEVLDAR